MINSALWITAVFVLAISAGPLAFLANQAGRLDAADVYLALDAPTGATPAADITTFGARQIGPVRGILTTMVLAPPSAHARLQEAGYIMFPASMIAALCGIDPGSETLNTGT